MPAPWIAGAELRVVGKLHDEDCINVWHFATNEEIFDGSQLDALLLQLAQAMLACVIDTLLPAVTSDYTIVSVEAKRIYPEASDPIIATAPANSVGQLGPTSVSFAASLLNIRTGGGGRRGRGRKFLPPPGEPQITTSAMDNDTLLLLVAFAACVAAKFTGSNPTESWVVGVYSRTRDNELTGTFDNSFRQATQLSPVALLAKIGSRRKGQGS